MSSVRGEGRLTTDKIIVRRIKVRRTGKGSVDFQMAFILPGAPEAAVRRSRAVRWPVNDKREAERAYRRIRLAAQDAVDADDAAAFVDEIKERARGESGRSELNRTDQRLGPTLSEFKSEFLDRYARVNNKPSEVESKEAILRRHLVPALGYLRLGDIRRREIDAYKADKHKSGLKPGTINNQLGVLSKLLKVAVAWELIDSAPAVGLLKNPKPKFDYLDFNEADRLLAGAASEPLWWTMILVGLRAGLRQGELLGLRRDDVDLVAGRLLVRQAVARGVVGTPKNGKGRTVPLSGDTVRALRRHRHIRGELVFCQDDGSLLTKGMCKHPLWRACRRAGLRRIGWHCLRHTFASHLAMRGKSMKAIQELLGHATMEMTMRYAHLAPVVHRDAVDALDGPSPFAKLASGSAPLREKDR